MSDRIQATRFTVSAGARLATAAGAEKARPALAEEQLAYARVLDLGMKVGMLVLTATFVAYVLGVPKPHIPVGDLPKYWSLPVGEYLAATGIQPGWGWVRMLGKGDFLNFIGIALLAGVTIPCYLAVIPVFLRKRDLIYLWLAQLEILVLALAASGVLQGGAH